MWKQTIGDWQERRHQRRGAPVPESPQVNLPESIISTESRTRGFLPRNFQDHVPCATCPLPDGSEVLRSTTDNVPLTQQAASSSIAAAWVVVSGVPLDDILDVREYFDAYIGLTVAHHLPSPTGGYSDIIYVQFADPLSAAQAVRPTPYVFQVENGVAAAGLSPAAGVTSPLAKQPHTLELIVGWCHDQVFLQERERLRRQIWEAVPRRGKGLVSKTEGSRMSPTPSSHYEVSTTRLVASPSLESSARGSDAAVSSGAATSGGDEEDAAAHPLLPRQRMRPSGRGLGEDRGNLPRGTSQTQMYPENFSFSTAAANPPVLDTNSYYSYNGHYRYEEEYFWDGLHSSLDGGAGTRPHFTVLSLFFHPCSSSSGVLSSALLYSPLRLVLLILWTLWNALASFLPSLSSILSRQRDRREPGAAPQLVSQPSRWILRRSLLAADVVPASASPLHYVTFLLYKYIPFVPDPEEVDVTLWSWLLLRSPYPQQSLRLLKQSLLARQRALSGVPGGFQNGRGMSSTSNASSVSQLRALRRFDVLGGEPYSKEEFQQKSELFRELPVLLTWRPAWWFTRYSSLSWIALVVALCSYFVSLAE